MGGCGCRALRSPASDDEAEGRGDGARKMFMFSLISLMRGDWSR